MAVLLLVPLVLIATAGVGWAACAIAGIGIVPIDVISAGLICLIAGAAAAIPLLLTRRSTQGAVAQAGLVATLVQLMFATGLAAVVFLAKLPRGIGPTFVYWLLGFYWMTLIVVA